MSHRILILDDDFEFNNLLTDIFEQADYEVKAVHAVEEALKTIESEGERFDLIVTDQRLPNTTGLEFIIQVRKKFLQVPIIMVSGYLDNDTIRDLIREGVNGIFIKPLNIFSLLKKANELIEQLGSGDSGGGDGATDELSASAMGISFLPCQSQAARDFAAKAKELSGFSRNLLLIGPSGMPYESICSDINRMSEDSYNLVCAKSGAIDAISLLERFTRAKEKGENNKLTLAVLNGDELSLDEVQVLMDCSAGRNTFEPYKDGVRIIFCLKDSVEDLYDKELISEDFYMFLGSNELIVPSLKEMRDEIVALVDRELKSIFPTGNLDNKSSSILQRHDWNNNILELREVVLKAVALADQNVPNADHFTQAIEGGEDQFKQAKSGLQEFLISEREIFFRTRTELAKIK